jgi:protease-4
VKKVIVTLCAVLGALVVLLGLVIGLFVAGSRLGKKGVAAHTVLELDLNGVAIPEDTPDDPFFALQNPNVLTMLDYVAGLEKAGNDPKVSGMIVRLGSAGMSTAHVQDLRDAFLSFRAKKKFLVAYAETFDGMGNYYLASACDQIYMMPTGYAFTTGMMLESPFLRGMLDKLGVKPYFEGRYEFKNAANLFMEKKYTAAHKEATARLGESIFNQMVKAIAESRKLSEAEVRTLIDKAPYYGQELLDKKLVDALHYRDDAYKKAKERAGADAKVLWLSKYIAREGKAWQEGKTVAVIYGVGGINQGKSGFDPLMGEQSMGSDTVTAAFRQAIDDKDVKAILFRVDSPGGSAVASDAIAREIQRARKAGKPVVSSMAGVAASGGYWVSMDCDRIVAQPATITGSIGVLAGKMYTIPFWEQKTGITFDHVKFGENATMWSSSTEFSPAELERFRAFLDWVYKDFTTRVAAGRKLPAEKVLEIAKGRVWTGEDGKARGLVDELGGWPAAIRAIRQVAKIGDAEEIRLRVFPRKKSPYEAILAKLQGEQGENSESGAEMVRSERDAVAAWMTRMQPVLRRLRDVGIIEDQRGFVRMNEISLPQR